ncbi:hypothetical protein ABOM_008172 [Aspergillus bombycis]|uniref:Uncharacterized protein n=1 Tax=Aspergillus bombycis TaxID=109264 RepID=A0A1F7ZTH9_9EURO|nr:hypothetical protein ABOM_008172 [Aspergillus bombycis]OGM42756.1 hypothetical protein ABOM_008172 [Aspergillus bombycis]
MSATGPCFSPGSCAMRLQNLDSLSSVSKSALLRSIADDISAAFICISKQLSCGRLSARHTKPIHDFVTSVKNTERLEQQRLQRDLERYRQRERRWRAERKWMHRKVEGLVKHSEEIHKQWQVRLARVKGNFDGAKRRLAAQRWKYELSRSQAEREKLLGRGTDATLAETNL